MMPENDTSLKCTLTTFHFSLLLGDEPVFTHKCLSSYLTDLLKAHFIQGMISDPLSLQGGHETFVHAWSPCSAAPSEAPGTVTSPPSPLHPPL